MVRARRNVRMRARDRARQSLVSWVAGRFYPGLWCDPATSSPQRAANDSPAYARRCPPVLAMVRDPSRNFPAPGIVTVGYKTEQAE
jgi:hypothetical protein